MTLVYRIEDEEGQGLWCKKWHIEAACPIHSRGSIQHQFHCFPCPYDEGSGMSHWWSCRNADGTQGMYLFAFPTVARLKEFVTPQMMYVLRKLDMRVSVLELSNPSKFRATENQVAYHRNYAKKICVVEAHRVNSINRFLPLHKRAS